MKTAICLVFFDDMKHLPRLGEALMNLRYISFGVFFIDNSGDKKHTQAFLKIYPKAIEIAAERNLGFAAGNNTLIQHALMQGYQAFWILNPDMAPEPGSLSLLTEVMDKDEEVWAAGPVICHGGTEKDPVIQLAGVKQNFKTQKKQHLYSGTKLDELKQVRPFEVDSLNGGALLLRSNLAKTGNLFEEKYFMYNDETDLLYRVRLHKKRSMVVPQSVVFHYHDWSKQNQAGYYRMYYYMMRNKFIFWRKYGMYPSLIKGLLKEIILFPVIFSFCKRTAGSKMVIFYYRGVFHGIINKTGKANFEFR